MIKLGIITDDFYPIIGGQGRHIYEIYKRLNQKEVIVFSSRKNNSNNHIQIKPFLYNKLKNFAISFWLYFNLNKLIKKYNLTRINIHCGPGGLFLMKKPKVPVIATCHHTYWQQSHYIRNEFWKRIFIPFEKRTYQLADKIICVSYDSKKILINKYKIKTNKIVVIPNGVDTTKYFPIKNIKKISKSLLYVGRLDKRKGIDFLIKTMPLIAKKIPDVKLFIGGRGKYLKDLKIYIEKNNLNKNVKYLGFIPDEKLNEWYNKVQCVIVPSIFEGFGITVIESMAAGTPVIGTNVDGIKEIIKDGKNGFLVSYGDKKKLTEVIIQLLNQNNLKICRNAFLTIKKNYSLQKISEIYEKELFN